jgi:hypothetical protein
MTINQKVSAGFVVLSAIFSAFFPLSATSVVFVVFSLSLFGLSLFLEKKDNREIEDLRGQIKQLKERVDNVVITKGMGR